MHLFLPPRFVTLEPADLAHGQAFAKMQAVRKEDGAQALVHPLVLVKMNGNLLSSEPGEHRRALQDFRDVNHRHLMSGFDSGRCDGADSADRTLKHKSGSLSK